MQCYCEPLSRMGFRLNNSYSPFPCVGHRRFNLNFCVLKMLGDILLKFTGSYGVYR